MVLGLMTPELEEEITTSALGNLNWLTSPVARKRWEKTKPKHFDAGNYLAQVILALGIVERVGS